MSSSDFGYHALGNKLQYFHGNSDFPSLDAQWAGSGALTLTMRSWHADDQIWQREAKSTGELDYKVHGLKSNQAYRVMLNDQIHKTLKSNSSGDLKFRLHAKMGSSAIHIRPITN